MDRTPTTLTDFNQTSYQHKFHLLLNCRKFCDFKIVLTMCHLYIINKDNPVLHLINTRHIKIRPRTFPSSKNISTFANSITDILKQQP